MNNPSNSGFVSLSVIEYYRWSYSELVAISTSRKHGSTISIETAKALVETGFIPQSIKILDLSGLTSICRNSAQFLSSSKGDINLSGLKSIDCHLVNEFSNHIGNLNLSGVNCATLEIIENLSAHA